MFVTETYQQALFYIVGNIMNMFTLKMNREKSLYIYVYNC